MFDPFIKKHKICVVHSFSIQENVLMIKNDLQLFLMFGGTPCIFKTKVLIIQINIKLFT